MDPNTAIAQYNQRHWSLEAGLPQAHVTAIAQTPDGYLWIGTGAGLVRFDGTAFTVFSSENTPILHNHEVRALLVDGTGDLWIAMHGPPGILRYRRGAFETFEDRLPGIEHQFISVARERSGRLWFGGWAGAVRLDVVAGHFTVFQRVGKVPIGSVRAFAEDAEGMWLGTHGSSWRVQGDRWQRPDGKLPSARSFLSEADGTLWIGTDHGLVRRKAGATRLFTTGDGLPDERVDSLLRDRDGALWVGTAGGLARLSGDRFESGGGFDHGVSALFEDREGNLWLGSGSEGLVRLRDGPFVSLPPGKHAGQAIRGTPDGLVWVATNGGGLLRVAGHDVTQMSAGPCGLSVRTMEVDRQGRLWTGTNVVPAATLCRLEGGAFAAVKGLPPRTPIRALLQGRTDFWVASDDQVFRVDGERLVAEPLPGRFGLHSLREDRSGVLWVGTEQGLLRRQKGQWKHVSGVSTSWIFDIQEDRQGGLWLATRGLNRFADGKVTHFGIERGLFEDPVYGIAEDDEQALWICSLRGVFRIRRQDLLQPRVAYTAFRAADGLGTNTCEGGEGQGGIWKAADGRLWFPTSRGAAYLDPRKVVPRAPPSPLVIQEVLFDGKRVEGSAVEHLGPGAGELAFSYAALTFTAPEKVRYRHRLEPLQRSWADGDATRTAHYLNLPPGQYRFRVLADVDGAPQELSATLALVLLPHAYERGWFRILAALVLVGLGAGAIGLVQRVRQRRLSERHELVLGERTRMARELHDTFSQGFTALAVQLEAASRRLATAPEKARENLDEARTLVRNSLTDARRAVWALRPQELEAGDLVDALTEIAGRLGAEAPVEVRIEGARRRLAEDLEIALVRIGQEALTNAFKHARAHRIQLTVIYAAAHVGLRITDDGAGFSGEARPPDGHFGLRGIRERVEALGGQLTVRSQPGQGTELSVEVPAR